MRLVRRRVTAYRYHPDVAAGGESGLSPGDWAVLGVVTEGATHGFAVAQLMAPNGALGRVWSLPRPVVYQALKKLTGLGLIVERAVESSDRGPQRTIVAATSQGHRAVVRWLAAPVEHVREVRSLLLLKLALIDRRGGDPSVLIAAQRQLLLPLLARLDDQHHATTGFEQVLVAWRLESCRAVLRFLDQAGQAQNAAPGALAPRL